MRCTICKKDSDETQLYTGIQEADMVLVCKDCAESEGIPIIKKPSESQLTKADKRYSVRERMEIMSGMRDTTEISDDQITTQKNLSKLRIPPKKEIHEDVLDNYYWTLNIERRRKKLSTGQLAAKMQVPAETIREIERGKLPENFREIFLKLEAYLGIKLLKNHETKVNFTRTKDEELEILESVRRRMEKPKSDEEDELLQEIELDRKKRQLDKISKGEIRFSKRENLSNVTLNDLVELKKEKEKTTSKQKESTMVGDDIDLDIDEL